MNSEVNKTLSQGKTMHSSGYILVYLPDHPFATKRGYVMEHRLVMEKHIGRFLTSEEVVHHINNIRTDNRIENLQLIQSNTIHLMHHQREFKKNVLDKRKCAVCGTNKTYRQPMHRKDKPTYYAYRWFKYEDGYVCIACYTKWYRKRSSDTDQLPNTKKERSVCNVDKLPYTTEEYTF